MDEVQQLRINTMQNLLASEYEAFDYKQVINLDIPDNYEYRDPRLLKIMNEKFEELFPEDEE
jgi:predicted protein tyrosine phosphatase